MRYGPAWELQRPYHSYGHWRSRPRKGEQAPPASNDGQGHDYHVQGTVTSGKANGWRISTASLPTFNFAYAAANPTGHKRGWSARQMSHAPAPA